MSLFTIYSSSAGSGKTFTLAKEYLKLVLRSDNPMYFQKILAMTFTNDAAEEMKQRILKNLVSIFNGTDYSKDLMVLLERELPDLGTEEIKNRAKNAHYEILQNYNDFAIKTIDSFVNQIVSSFTFDLNLPYNYEIVLDTQELLTEAVGNLIDRVGTDEALTEMLKDFALDKIDENKGWNTLASEIVTFGGNIFKDNNAVQIEKNTGLTHNDVREIRKKIKAYFKETEDQIQKLAKEALQLVQSKGLNETDFTQGNRGVYGFIVKVANSAQELFEKGTPNSYVIQALEKDNWYKAKAPSATVIDEIKGTLSQLISDIIELKSEKYQVLKVVNQNLLKIPFLSVIKKEIDTVLSDRNEVVLADFNQKILDVVSNEPVPYIFERIGEKYNHILVDEFQDTSDIQFFNMLPLFENSISKNQFNLIVGDPKQAIYSWRGGNVMLMLDLISKENNYLNHKAPEIQQGQINIINTKTKVENLSINYRSHEAVIDFNNALFSSMISHQESSIAKQVFSDYIQLTPPQPKPGGYVALDVLEKEDDIALKINALLEEILADGYRQSDIAILCRKGKEAEEIAEILKKSGYNIDSTEALKLKNNLEVKLLMSGLRFYNKPERQFERFEFLEFFFLSRGIDSSLYDINAICSLSVEDYRAFYKQFEVTLHEMPELGSYQLLEYLSEKLSLFQLSNSSEYILALLDFSLDFTTRKSKSLADFLEIWDIKKEKLSVASQKDNAITISTIHKAKGLEYAVVIMPYVNWDTKPRSDSGIWIGLEDVDYPELYSSSTKIHSAPFKYSDEFSFTKEILEHENDLYAIENLNLLYVALTRAVERQYLLCYLKKTQREVSFVGIGSILYDFLNEYQLFNLAQLNYEWGEKTPKIQKEKEEKAIEFIEAPHTFSENTSLRLQTADPDADDKIQQGNIIHLAFERIKKEEDVEPVLQSLLNENIIQAEEIDHLRDKVLSVITHPELSLLFGKSALVKNEVEILSSHTQVKRPDRVIFVKDEVYVLDYKTGKKSSSHSKQLKEYAALLRQMGYQNIKLILVYLEPLVVVNV